MDQDRKEDRNAEPPSDQFGVSGRNTDGTFSRGNLAALKHGGRSKQVACGDLAEQAAAKAALEEKARTILADLGDPEAAVLKVEAVERYVYLKLVEDWLTANIVTRGPLTPKGRQRAALSALLQVSDRLTRLSAQLGLERRSKRLDLAQSLSAPRASENQP
jgi:hypothetical protein